MTPYQLGMSPNFKKAMKKQQRAKEEDLLALSGEEEGYTQEGKVR